MDFFVEFVRTLFYFILLAFCGFGGIMIGKTLRARKINKMANHDSENK